MSQQGLTVKELKAILEFFPENMQIVIESYDPMLGEVKEVLESVTRENNYLIMQTGNPVIL